MSRFELKNYKNTILIEDSILISNTFYQSAEHFKFRSRNSNSDELRKISSILEIEFHSIGNILTLKFNDGIRKLVFNSNEKMIEFLELINIENMELTSDENLSLKKSIISTIIPVFIILIIVLIVFENYKGSKLFKYLPLFTGFIIAIVSIIKKHLKSSIVKYKKNYSQ